MSISFEGIGQWCASFACEDVAEGMAVKLTDNGKVGKCGAGEDFCGVVAAMGRDGKACSVQMGGFVTLPYSGDEVPVLGICTLSADGEGGVQSAAGGWEYLAVCVDQIAKTVTIKL